MEIDDRDDENDQNSSSKNNSTDPLENMNNASDVERSLNSFANNSLQGIKVSLSNQFQDTTENFFSCPYCSCFMIDPVTLKCGHTFMKTCLQNTLNCSECKLDYPTEYISSLKTTVAISAVLEKWWNSELKSVKMCTLGKELYQKGESQKAIEMLTSALNLDPQNHIAALYRSIVHHSTNKLQEALTDAELALNVHIFLEGYLQKGAVLTSLEKINDAIATYYECFLLCSNSESAFVELKKLVRRMINEKSHCDSLVEEESMDETGHVSKLSQSQTNNDCDTMLNVLMQHIMTYGKNDIENSEKKFMLADQTMGKIPMLNQLQELLYSVFQKINTNGELKPEIKMRKVDSSLVDRNDFECPLCIRLLWQPITTPCGHTFCRTCLDRCFDHQPICPLCKTFLADFLAERNQNITHFIENAIRILLPNDYMERKKIYEDELQELQNAGKDAEHVIPLFVCTIAFPTVPCPLHVFEPRYRLMIRRCMEAGTRSFGMCSYISNEPDGIARFGTLLEIRSLKYFPDGRSLVDACGGKRFKVLSSGMKDGYHTAAVEFLQDEIPDPTLIAGLTHMHDQVRHLSENWFTCLPSERKRKIMGHFGVMPPVEADYFNNPNGPTWFWWMLAILPLDDTTKLRILGMTSLYRRLITLEKILEHLQANNIL